MTVFFPILFSSYWSTFEKNEQTFYVGWTNSLASLVLILIGPVLGSIADRYGTHKRFLLAFAILGVITSAALYWVEAGWWWLAAMLYIFATVGFMGANIFYDALLVFLSDESDRDRLSLWGYGLGYLGGGLALAICIIIVFWPTYFGLADSLSASRVCLVVVALWWLIFLIPLAIHVPESKPETVNSEESVIWYGFKKTYRTFCQIRQYRTVWLFLLAYWFYIDAVDTIVRMASIYAESIGLNRTHTITALLITQFIGFPAAIGYIRIAQLWGVKYSIYLAIAVYVFVCLWAYQMHYSWEFYVLAILVGLVQGGIQALSRSYFATLIPSGRAGEFFGFYNMLGKSAAILGPFLVGWVSYVENSRLGILALLILLIIGAIFLSKVNQSSFVQSG